MQFPEILQVNILTPCTAIMLIIFCETLVYFISLKIRINRRVNILWDSETGELLIRQRMLSLSLQLYHLGYVLLT